MKHLLTILLLSIGLGALVPAMADPLKIEITQGVEGALPIAIVPFAEEGARHPPEDIAKIISADLARTGQFKTFPVKDMLSKPTQPSDIKFQNWRVLGVNNLVIGNVRYLGTDKYEVNFWLYDVFKAKQLPSFRLPGTDSTLRATAHKISDVIYQQLLGVPGAFSTRIAYVTAKRKGGKPYYSLWMADADGANSQSLLNSRQPIMSPAWSPDGKRIAYASLEQGGRQRIFIQNWATGKRNELKVPLPGLIGAPAWSPDGKKLAFTITYNGNADIYVLDLGSNDTRQLTNHWAIDTEAAWMPDGKSIIFTSDRGGRPQLYKMSSSGGAVTRLTFDGQENARASISPDGKLVAMVHRVDGNYKIAVMELATGDITVLTPDGVLDESPSFAPNGSMIIYATTKGNRATLAFVSADGRIRQKVTYQDDVREPAWSPINK